MKLILTCSSCIPLLVMLLKGVIEFPKVPNYQSHTQKLLNNGLFTANVLSTMILSDTNVSRSCYHTGPQPTKWPPRSLDLTMCDFFLWGFVKRNAFTTPSASIEDMRDWIINELANLREDPDDKKGVQGYAEAC